MSSILIYEFNQYPGNENINRVPSKYKSKLTNAHFHKNSNILAFLAFDIYSQTLQKCPEIIRSGLST